MKSARNQRVTITIIAVFFATHLFCICGGAASAAARSVEAQIVSNAAGADDPHACCKHHGEKTRSHLPACQHCTSSQLSAPEAAKLGAPVMSASPAFPTSARFPSLASAVSSLSWQSCRDTHGPPGALALTCVLLL